MSNPGVITLASLNSKKNTLKRFQVEDNIGESIHLHIDNIRIDFSINDFLDFSDKVRESLVELNLFYGYSINNFDIHFLHECGNSLYDLSKITIEEVSLSDLKCIVKKKYYNDELTIDHVVPINKTPAFLYLHEDNQEFVTYSQFNYFGLHNKNRLVNLLNSIKKHNYPYENSYIIIFSGQNIIRDGQHRAAILAHLYGLKTNIKVMVFHFEGKQHLFKKNINNFKSIVKWILKKVRSKLTMALKKLKMGNIMKLS